MKNSGISRRGMLKGSGALLAGAAFSTRVMADAPPPEPVTPALIEAAKKEGQVSYYTSTDLPVAEKLAKAFEAKYPGIAVRVERAGAERIFQRIGQEKASRIYAVDVVCSTDPAHFLDWKSKGWVAPYVPEDVSKYFPPEHVDPSGMHATLCAWLEVIGTTPISSRARMPRRAMPTCSTPSGGDQAGKGNRALAGGARLRRLSFRARSRR